MVFSPPFDDHHFGMANYEQTVGTQPVKEINAQKCNYDDDNEWCDLVVS
jgi:hypothetical protein